MSVINHECFPISLSLSLSLPYSVIKHLYNTSRASSSVDPASLDLHNSRKIPPPLDVSASTVPSAGQSLSSPMDAAGEIKQPGASREVKDERGKNKTGKLLG